MADNVENLTHEMLRRVHSKLDEIQAEMRLRFTGVETGLAAIEHRLVAFHLIPFLYRFNLFKADKIKG